MFGRDEKVSPMRLTAVQYIILAVFLMLTYGLWRLQVAQSDLYANLAEKNRIRDVPILAPRGKILDREGRTIVDNYPSFTALLMRDSSRDLSADAGLIAEGLHLDPKDVRDRIRKFAAMPQYQPIYLKDDITPDELAFIEAHRNELPELETIMAYRRLYPRNGFTAHLIGYVGEVSEQMLNQPQFELYNPGDVVGKSGVELEYNQILMGKNGSKQVIVNSRGKEMGELAEKPAEPGKPLKLTVDIDLQIAAEEAIAGKNGAIVAMDPHTGEILAMVSRPSLRSQPVCGAHLARRLEQAGDRSRETAAQPGNPGAARARLDLQDHHVGGGLAGRDCANPQCALQWGRDVLWPAVRMLGEDRPWRGRSDAGHLPVVRCLSFTPWPRSWALTASQSTRPRSGWGRRPGLICRMKPPGVMPSEEWKIRNFKQKWFAGETISVGIGQGAVATTPIQLMRAIAAISMDGRMVVPHVVDPIGLPQNYLEVNHYAEVKSIPIEVDGWNLITDAMGRVLLPGGHGPLGAHSGN